MRSGDEDSAHYGRDDREGPEPSSADLVEPSAYEVRGHLVALQAERVEARLAGLASDGAYMADLETEIATVSYYYTLRAVTEIATLRAELFGADEG